MRFVSADRGRELARRNEATRLHIGVVPATVNLNDPSLTCFYPMIAKTCGVVSCNSRRYIGAREDCAFIYMGFYIHILK
jgi:hypothetical protein